MGLLRLANLLTVSVYFVLCLVCFSSSTGSPSTKIKVTSRHDLPSLCQRQCSHGMNGTQTMIYCEKHKDELKLEGRCCVNTTQGAEGNGSMSVVGIDLQNCHLGEKKFADAIQNMSNLAIISLEGNFDITKVTDADFNRNIGIKYLALPANVSCPGGEDAWGQVDSTSLKTTCLNELDACNNTNVKCPENSHCEQTGILLTECLCDEDYHGYKCLNKGTFPITVYVIGLIVPTIAISILLWLTQRRYVKPKSKRS